MEAGGELNIERESSSGQNNFSSRSDLNPQFPMTKANDNEIILSSSHDDISFGKNWQRLINFFYHYRTFDPTV